MVKFLFSLSLDTQLICYKHGIAMTSKYIITNRNPIEFYVLKHNSHLTKPPTWPDSRGGTVLILESR